MKQVYVCSDTVTGVFSGIYDAWKTKKKADELGIALRGQMEQELFCEYMEVEESEKKALAVARLIQKHLSYDAYWHIYHALLSDDGKKGDAVLGTMLAAREIPDSTKIMRHLTHPQVQKVFELSRRANNEAHYMIELVRFVELENGILFSQIEPKCQVLPCMADHFENRFPLENWMIYDKTNEQFLVHESQKKWILVSDVDVNLEKMTRISHKEYVYAKLWKGFFESISIKERENYERQRQHLPIRLRKYLTEFQE